MQPSRSSLGLVLLLSLSACSHDPDGSHGDAGGGGDPLAGLLSIEVTPPNATLTVEGDTPATSSYTATGKFSDGHSEDISTHVVFTLANPGLGSFAGAQLSTGTAMGGRTAVVATGGGMSGATQLTVLLKKRYADPQATGLPTDPSTIFAGANTGSGAALPDLVYPNDGVLVPPNLGKLEFHFRPGQGNTLFELAFQSDTSDVRVYTRCTQPMNGGCIYLPDPTVWTWIAESNRGGGMTVKVRATDDAASTPVLAESASLQVAFSHDNIEGGIYYWTTPKGGTDADSAILRWDFGSKTQTAPEKVISTSLTGNKCVGCHTLSHDGKKLIVASDGSYNANLLLFDLEKQMAMQPFNSTPPNAYTAFSPDSSKFVGTFADETQAGFQSYDLNVFDGASGSFIETIAAGGSEDSPSAHPDWSADGNAIAFTRIGVASDKASGTTARGYRANVRLVQRANSTWGAPIDLTTSEAGKSSYYPAFAPDGTLVAFNRSACTGGTDGTDCDMYDDPQASMHVIAPRAGAQPIALTRANAPGKGDTATVVENSFPKWAPFVFQLSGEQSSRLMWITMSSDRAYGLRKPEPGFTMIWMVAIDPDKVANGEDPSFPAFALPFQNLATDNHTAQWTTAVVGQIL